MFEIGDLFIAEHNSTNGLIVLIEGENVVIRWWDDDRTWRAYYCRQDLYSHIRPDGDFIRHPARKDNV
ncbi:unnamed protein product [marine sediment metagenome]|uniref:Uncharacterized protein n=1 Tax=marine sediment metagenome TaxID=412755 RepID=X0T292_9ZZZZ